MSELNQIIPTPKNGTEDLTFNGQKTEYKLLDFWRCSVSDLLSNATRGRLAEFIVGTAVGLNPDHIRDEWGAYDLKTEDGIKIEVKSAAYIQCWSQKCFSTISFSIKRSVYWDPVTNIESVKSRRHADLYVFCVLKHKDQSSIDPLKMEQWDFYILPTYRLDNYERSQSSITLNSLQKLTDPVSYIDLNNRIQKAFLEQSNYISHSV